MTYDDLRVGHLLLDDNLKVWCVVDGDFYEWIQEGFRVPLDRSLSPVLQDLHFIPKELV